MLLLHSKVGEYCFLLDGEIAKKRRRDCQNLSEGAFFGQILLALPVFCRRVFALPSYGYISIYSLIPWGGKRPFFLPPPPLPLFSLNWHGRRKGFGGGPKIESCAKRMAAGERDIWRNGARKIWKERERESIPPQGGSATQGIGEGTYTFPPRICVEKKPPF